MVDRQQQQYARAKDGKGMLLSPGGVCLFILNFVRVKRDYDKSSVMNLMWQKVLQGNKFFVYSPYLLHLREMLHLEHVSADH